MRDLIFRIYDRTIDVIIIGLVLVMIVVMAFAFFQVALNVWALIPSLKANMVAQDDFRDLIVNLLDVFVLIELFATFTRYVRTRHVGMTQLLDVTIVFALRELLVKLYGNRFSANELIGLCAIVILLIVGRSLTSRFSPHAGT
ncbi:MAG: phosphate-starvation-inducible PsiE family protein [Steroidobacteraceae bacterium]